ncbi:aminodeoxychorismate synthase component I [Rhodanobacter hydrolyticus]|uniref:Aminodeoxychorismate synthase component I n=1 Tax=Rhodanobacter hydrolyticus TaxID=2250595 RepID=A0ABW8J2P1_9GAMM|nr:aminodeoxychorismate synthase component I [Rhodanobacter sp. 7MK24]MBD8879638.1 aminodeoxychorismate synthase component I [Rhodanobacter sp. 7MK24]
MHGRRDLLAPAAAFPQRYPCLLESVLHGTPQARYDILFAFPQGSLTLTADGVVRDASGDAVGARFLDALDSAWRAERLPREEDGLPFHGGWALLLGYELASEIEPKLRLRTDAVLPVALALRCPAAVIVDHARGCTVLVAEAGSEHLLDVLEADLATAPATSAPTLPLPVRLAEDEPKLFLDGVARIHEHLSAGDIFQVNLSRAWRAHYAEPPTAAALHLALRRANPAPFAGLLQQPGWAIASSSPERLVEVRDGIAQTRPIAGTRPRTVGDDDVARIRELAAHPKERAEHVMLIDLERNDLGRVCVPGTVEVDELMTVESYAHVHHIVSNVRGRLREGVTPGQAIAAVFPGGTITGCPKVRCMQIIAALEDAPRGAYTGALGYLDRNGDLDLNILIRTLTLTGDTVCLRAGAGIVADSEAEKELDETRAKARGLLRALGAGDT